MQVLSAYSDAVVIQRFTYRCVVLSDGYNYDSTSIR